MSLATPIVQLIDPDPVAVDIEQRLSEAIRLLSAEKFHHVPIVEGRRLVGLISATDIIALMATAPGEGDYERAVNLDHHYRVEDIMRRDLITIDARSTVGEAARLLSAGGFHGLPVVDTRGNLVGMLTTTDLVEHMLEAGEHAAPATASAERLRRLEAVLDAALHLLHSGLGAQEQARLERAVEAARAAGQDPAA